MSSTTKQELLYGFLTAVFMAAIMLSYNAIGQFGFTHTAFIMIITQYIPILLAAFAVSQLVVVHNVHRLHKIIVSPHDSKFKHFALMILLMVTGMCLSLSLYSTIIFTGTDGDFWMRYLSAVARNFPVALLAEAFIVGPLVRVILKNMYKSSPLVD